MTQADSRPGLSLAEVLTLPDEQRKIVQWMMRRSDGVSLVQVESQIQEETQNTLAFLDELIDQGYIQEFLADGEIKYRVNLAAKRGIQQQTLQQSLAPGSPLAVIYNPSGDLAVKTNSKFEIFVTVTNKGAESALIDVYIDELSHQLIQWCDAPRQRLALGPNSSGEVLFEFIVPATALPNIYNYVIVVDAPQHYPEHTPIRHTAKVQVIPEIETVVRASDPTFVLLPPTSSRSPAQIPPGGSLQVSVNVYNRSDRVDKFRLSCSDIDPTWLSIRYPEGLETLGLIVPNMGLELNPGERGEIYLLLNPPYGIDAGLYYPTIRLHSANNPDLVLLDVVYLEVMPIYMLNIEVLTIVGRVKRKAGIFEVKLANNGNTTREIVCNALATEEEKLCTYKTSQPVLRVLPGERANTQITVKPDKWWKRPLFGSGKLINFRIQLEDQQKLPLPNSTYPGTLIWEARPWWQFLLLFITFVGIVGTIIFLIWWALRPSRSPRIELFKASDSIYEQANGDFIRLNWNIRYTKYLYSITIEPGEEAEGVQPRSYIFNGRVPDELKPFCRMGETLVCTNVPTEARKAGNYKFLMKAFIPDRPELEIDKRVTSEIRINPVPPPKVLEFASAQNAYQEARPSLQNPNTIGPDVVRLNWRVTDIDKIREVRITGRSPEGDITSPPQSYGFIQGLPKTLEKFCKTTNNSQLICKNVPANNRGAGDYTFEMQVFTRTDTDKPSVALKTDVIKVQPQPSRIVDFKLNGANPLPKYSIPLIPGKKFAPITISWKVEGSKNIKVELLPAPGSVPVEGAIAYPISDQPKSETITLQVTSPTGEKVTRSVTIDTILLPPVEKPSDNNTPQLPKVAPVPPANELPAIPAGAAAGGGQSASSPAAGGGASAGGGNASGSNPSGSNGNSGATPAASGTGPSAPAPSQPGQLSPLELPPSYDSSPNR
ncbi:MAG TPA: hypothetical protein VK203_25360 [Nostocaceae cyanobacterium]|nr:hypothetical protein [Nostocaceae cyanobacterium]